MIPNKPEKNPKGIFFNYVELNERYQQWEARERAIVEAIEKIVFDPYYEATTPQRKLKNQIDNLLKEIRG